MLEAVAVSVSVEVTGSGERMSVGAGGGVLILMLNDVNAVSPVLSVAVMVRLCSPAVRVDSEKEIFPLESEP
jgi:hypothetical protein